MRIINYLRVEENNHKLMVLLMLVYAFSLPFAYDKYVFSIILAVFLFGKNFKMKIFDALNDKFVLACLIYFLVICLWIPTGENFKDSFHEMKQHLVLLYPLIFYHTLKHSNIRTYLYVFIIAFIITSIFSYLIYFNIIENIFHYDNSIVGEPLAFLYKTDFTTFLVIVVCYLVYKLFMNLSNRELNIKIILFGIVLLLIGNLFLIGSRTGIVIFCILFLITIITIVKKRHINILKSITLGAIIFSGLTYFAISVNDYDTRIMIEVDGVKNALVNENYNSSFGSRLGMWKYGIEIIKDNWLFGVGSKNQLHELERYLNEKIEDLNNKKEFKEILRVISSNSGVHNGYIDVLLQFGIIGLFLMLNVFLQLFRVNCYNEDTDLNFLKYLILGSFMLSFLTGGNFAMHKHGEVFVFLSLIIVIKYHQQSQKKDELSEVYS